MRMLHNLRGVYFMRRAAEEYKQRGIIQMQLRNPASARSDPETYLRLWPEAVDRGEIEKHLRALRSY
jgi:regulator of sirC expression with transglutaminase-like and TPR domain